MWLNGFIRLYVMYAIFLMAPYTTTLSQKSPETNKTRHALKNIIFSEHDRSDEVIFPDEDVPLIPKLNAAPKCAKKSSTYCEILDTYPHRHVQEVLRNGVQEYTLFFGEDESEPEMVHRIGDVERFVCPSVAKVIFPQGAKNTKNEWRFIVNQMDESYVQGIRVEECARANRPCDIAGSTPDGVEMTCKQKYVYRRLLAISEHGKPTVDTFLFPSACCCSYKRNFDSVLDWNPFRVRLATDDN